ncbi:sulfoxide reductase catalytic subunit YedY [Arboricoccus pini]|uniref:Protein-methionine-sulfoxide reductase catalytic subunit MsrP n=1 Tax=Arboricoccus pini TaxID=1963835 RepID=A0A212R2J8_9PROT|nr:protein-methionine-sulfoxide reductase catalytic subunit MsrP [Arboricoccus pini]SNB66207.1 sulfoxide reductase catalytic subunit YedY [Arboricoccus pini]
MLTRSRRVWEVSEGKVTPEAIYLRRRNILGAAIGGSLGLSFPAVADEATRFSDAVYPARKNPAYGVDRPVTAEKLVTSYNNFYEFGTSKDIADAAQMLKTSPWTVKIAGLVEQPRDIDIEELVKAMPVEERIYRHRCVEAWSIIVPWTGFPLKALVDYARPLGSARYLKMLTFNDPSMAPGQQSFLYSWPYVEGLTLAEAGNELAFMSIGVYGKPLPNQNGAPLRLTIPWKYGFKSIKSVVCFEFTDERPKSFWEALQASEYGFWANVNPKVPHPRWSQATEEEIGTGQRIPTLLFNGYAEQVAGLYTDLENEPLYR